MPYQVNWESRGVYTRYYGHVTGADMRGNIEDVCRDERFEQHRYHILDFSDATEFMRHRKGDAGQLRRARRCGVHESPGHGCRSSHAGQRKGDFRSTPCARRVPLTRRRYCPTLAEARKWIEESGFTSGRYSVALARQGRQQDGHAGRPDHLPDVEPDWRPGILASDLAGTKKFLEVTAEIGGFRLDPGAEGDHRR